LTQHATHAHTQKKKKQQEKRKGPTHKDKQDETPPRPPQQPANHFVPCRSFRFVQRALLTGAVHPPHTHTPAGARTRALLLWVVFLAL
jgi:hypothetical protein